MITVVLSAGLPASPFIPSLPVLPVAPCGPTGPGTATGTATGAAGTFTTVGLSQAARLNVASTAEINIELFMVNPLNMWRRKRKVKCRLRSSAI